jgi:hypothetical protein
MKYKATQTNGRFNAHSEASTNKSQKAYSPVVDVEHLLNFEDQRRVLIGRIRLE